MMKTTRLHNWHTAHGANMADFGGYEMPLWYPSGVKEEHLSVLNTAGIFDTSHMAMIRIDGSGAFDLLQFCFSKDLSGCLGLQKLPISPGRCVYGVFLNENGHVIDDALVYMVAENRFLVVVNAGMGPVIAGHLSENRNDLKAEIRDLTDAVGKLDVQGPMAGKILAGVLKDPDAVFDSMPYFSFKGHFDPAAPESDAVELKNGARILLSRTGYTGEFGFEIFTAPDDFVAVWDLIQTAGKNFGLVTCGLAARDSLRGGAMLPLSHQDIGAWPFMNNPWIFALPRADDGKSFTKPFIGANALLSAKNAEHTVAFAGRDLRKITAGEDSRVLDSSGREIGRVLTCVTDMGIGMKEGVIFSVASPDLPKDLSIKGLSCGFVLVSVPLAQGDTVEIKDARRKIPVTIVSDIRPHRTARTALKKML